MKAIILKSKPARSPSWMLHEFMKECACAYVRECVCERTCVCVVRMDPGWTQQPGRWRRAGHAGQRAEIPSFCSPGIRAHLAVSFHWWDRNLNFHWPFYKSGHWDTPPALQIYTGSGQRPLQRPGRGGWEQRVLESMPHWQISSQKEVANQAF